MITLHIVILNFVLEKENEKNCPEVLKFIILHSSIP